MTNRERILRADVRPAGHPINEGYELVWQTPIMPAPSFWYFATEDEARDAAARILNRHGRTA